VGDPWSQRTPVRFPSPQHEAARTQRPRDGCEDRHEIVRTFRLLQTRADIRERRKLRRRAGLLLALFLPATETGQGADGRAQRREIPARRDGVGTEHLVRRIGVQLEKFRNERLGIDARRLGVGAEVGAAKQPARPVLQVILLERCEQRHFDLGVARDLDKADALVLTLRTQQLTERCVHETPPGGMAMPSVRP